MTYHGEPPLDGKIYEPNHIDGDKHNNHPKNLEWLTRSKNVQHAFNSGLATGGLKIDAINVDTKEVKRYVSLNSMSREWNIPRHILRNIISRHRDIPYLGLWIFVVDDKSDKKISRYQQNEIKFKDYVTGDIYIVSDSTEASMKTGVQASTIKSRVNGKIKNSNVLLSRYIFKLPDDMSSWPDFTVKEALESEKKYKENSEKIKFSRK